MTSRHLLIVSLTLVCLTSLIAVQKSGSSVQTKQEGGLYTAVFETKPGKIVVYLPDDMAAGDTISGTVVAEPAGGNDKEKQRNAAELNGYVVELENQKSPVSGGVMRRVILAPDINEPSLILLDEKGTQVATFKISVAPAPSTIGPSTFVVGGVGQSGKPIVVHGPFDGDSANTSAKVGGADAKVLGESPREMVCDSPRNVIGPTKIEVTENGATATGPFRNLKIDLTAPKTSLRKGESTELHVEVSGLQGITQPIPIQIQNQSPSTVNLSGGNTQTIPIQPGQVQTGGTFSWSGGLTGIQSGGFFITGTIPSGIYASPNPSTMPPSTSTPTMSPMPAPSPPRTGTVPTRPTPTPTPGGEPMGTEMVQLQLQGSRPVTGPVTRPMPTPTPTPTSRPVTSPSPTGTTPRPMPTPTPTPTPVPTPTPTPTPCVCDLVSLSVSEGNNGVNKVTVTKVGDVLKNGDIVGAKVMVTLKFVDHEIKCTGGPSPEKCSATADWTLNPAFKITAKGSSWSRKDKDPKGVNSDGDVKYEEFKSKKASTQIVLEGTCDPTAKAAEPPSYTVSQTFEVDYPDELVAKIKEAKATNPKPKVDVGEITGTITWTVTAKDCKSQYGRFLEGRRRLDSGALIRPFVLTGVTY